MKKKGFYKTFGKLTTYMGLLSAIHGIVHKFPFIFAVGIVLVILGCLVHELNEGGD